MRSIAKHIVLLMLRGYKWAISPMLAPACRFVPTCSEYAMEAVERYGAMRGAWMAIWRVLRCHPLARGGYDPVVRGRGQESGVRGQLGCDLREMPLDSNFPTQAKNGLEWGTRHPARRVVKIPREFAGRRRPWGPSLRSG